MAKTYGGFIPTKLVRLWGYNSQRVVFMFWYILVHFLITNSLYVKLLNVGNVRKAVKFGKF